MLALRKSVGNLSGRLLVNGKPATARFIRLTSYVPQVKPFPSTPLLCQLSEVALLVFDVLIVLCVVRDMQDAALSSCQLFQIVCQAWRAVYSTLLHLPPGSHYPRNNPHTTTHPTKQDDTFIPTMSTKETLTFYAGVTLGDGWSRASRTARAAEVLEAVGLGHTVDTLVSRCMRGTGHVVEGKQRCSLSPAHG